MLNMVMKFRVGGSLRILCSLLVGAGLASAQCYSFSAGSVTYTINVSGVNSQTSVLGVETTFSVQQVSTLTVGGKTYVSPSSTATLSIESQGGQSSFMAAYAQVLTAPPWSVNVSLIGENTQSINSLPASLPGISAWQDSKPQLTVFVFNAIGPVTYTITAVGSCVSGGGGGTGGGSGTGSDSTVPGQSLGDPSSIAGCPVCGGPINIGTGNMFEPADDYHTAGANTLGFKRYYNSMAGSNTLAASLGSNWRSIYFLYLDLSASSVVAERPDGQQVTFALNNGAWTTDADIDLTLTNSGSTWTLTDHQDTLETYTAVSGTEGLLQTIAARNGYTQSLQYGANNQLATVTDSFGRQLAFSYNGALLQSVTTPDGLVLSFGFGSAGKSSVLTSVSYSTTPVTTRSYVYENSALPSALTGIIDENGARYMSWTYDSDGARPEQPVRRRSRPGIGGLQRFRRQRRTVTGPLGLQGLYHYATVQNVPKLTELDFAATATTPGEK